MLYVYGRSPGTHKTFYIVKMVKTKNCYGTGLSEHRNQSENLAIIRGFQNYPKHGKKKRGSIEKRG